MNKIALTSLGCLLVIGQGVFGQQTPAAAPAAKPATETAIERSLVLQGYKEDMKRRLADAQAAQKKGDLLAATKYYEDALTAGKNIPSGAEAEYNLVKAGMVETRLQLAEQAQRRGDFNEAEAQIKRLLAVDPKNETVLAFQQTHYKIVEQQAGRRPDEASIAQLSKGHESNVEAGTLVQNGKLLYEAGMLEEADKQLRRAAKLDPDNKAAFYYMELIREKRFDREQMKNSADSKDKMLEVSRAWVTEPSRELLPVPNPYARTNMVLTSKGRQAALCEAGEDSPGSGHVRRVAAGRSGEDVELGSQRARPREEGGQLYCQREH